MVWEMAPEYLVWHLNYTSKMVWPVLFSLLETFFADNLIFDLHFLFSGRGACTKTLSESKRLQPCHYAPLTPLNTL